MDETAYRVRRMWIRVCLIAAAVALSAALAGLGASPAPSAGAVPADGAGYKDFRYTDADSTGVDGTDASGREVSGPTSEKPQSKLWFNDGTWWGVLFNPDGPGDGAYEIHRYDRANHAWSSTGTLVDARNDSRADAIWDGRAGKLYVASSGPKSADVATDEANRGIFRSYSYDAAGNTYTPGGEPISVTDGGVEALVLERDTTGQFWVTFTRNSKVRVNRSLDAAGANWGTPFILQVPGADNLTADDISSIVSFDGKIGVMWSNQTDNTVRFASHADSNADDTAFTEGPPPVNRPNGADDHINLKSLQADASGRVFAAVKTSETAPDAPLILLLVRNQDGTFEEHTFGTVADDHTRPIVLIDRQNGDLYVFATAPTGGGTIFYKRTPLSDVSFAPGRGTPFIRSSTDTGINDATSTKQNLNGTTDLLVLASDRSTDFYFHNYLNLAGAANTAPTVTNVRPVPGSKTKDTTPVISATVRDAQTELRENNVSLFVDGKQIGRTRFVYDPGTDRLRYGSGKLSPGAHRVKLVARDGQGLSATKTWGFRVVRR